MKKLLYLLLGCLSYFGELVGQDENNTFTVHLALSESIPTQPSFYLDTTEIKSNYFSTGFNLLMDYGPIAIFMGWEFDTSNKGFSNANYGLGYVFNSGRRIQFPLYLFWGGHNDGEDGRNATLATAYWGGILQANYYLTNNMYLFGGGDIRYTYKVSYGGFLYRPNTENYRIRVGVGYSIGDFK